MSAVGSRLEACFFHPAMDNLGVLPHRQVERVRHSAGEQEIQGLELGMSDPSLHGLAGRVGDLELGGAACFLLYHHGAGCHLPAMRDIRYPELH